MHAGFGLQPAISVGPGEQQGGGLDAGLLTFTGFHQFDFVAVLLGPAVGELGGDRQLSNLADVLLKQNKYREALELLTEELAAKPGDLDVLANRSAAYMKIGMLREGLDDLRAAAQGGSAYAQCELGRYYMIGIPGVLTPDPAAGIEWFTKSAAQGYSAGQENLRRARQLFGDSPPH